jgi:tripartite-type tricarboxylate transporter receptor subunit TctC
VKHIPISAFIIPAAVLVATGAHAAQPDNRYPTKPVRVIVPFAPGGGTDITGRSIAQKLSERLGQTFVVDNRAGANGTIGADLAAKAAPDGYTISMISSSHSVNPSLMKKLPYDLTTDLAPITQATTQPYALVIHPTVAAKSVKDLIALAKAKPGSLNYGSSGTGGLSHLSGALLAHMAEINIIHIPYKGGSPALADVVAGQIQMLFSTLLQAQAQLKSGRLRALAVTTAKRSRGAPDLPTMAEAGVKGYEVAGWYGVVATAKTPKPILDRLNREILEILKGSDIADKLAADGSEPVGSTQEEFGHHIKNEVAKWQNLIQKTGIKAD